MNFNLFVCTYYIEFSGIDLELYLVLIPKSINRNTVLKQEVRQK